MFSLELDVLAEIGGQGMAAIECDGCPAAISWLLLHVTGLQLCGTNSCV